MISEAYQSYSNRGRARELANVIAYLKAQIRIDQAAGGGQ